MLSEKNQKILTEQFNSLPEEIQEVILESDWKSVIRRITDKYSLHLDQGGALETIVFLTMLGLEDPSDFALNLKSEVRVTPSLAQTITAEVEKDIFQKIRQSVIEKETQVKTNKSVKTSDDGVDIIEDESHRGGRDAYREDVGDHTSQYVDGQHLDAESILRDVEDPESNALADHSDIEIPEEVFSTKGVDFLEENTELQESDDINLRHIPDSTIEKNKEIKRDNEQSPLTSQETKDPMSVRTFKSDILRQKLANPSWSPTLDKSMTKNTKKIIKSAQNESLKENESQNPKTKNDPYHEAI